MHVPCPIFELRCFIFVFQYNFKRAFNSDMNDLQSISLVLLCFLKDLACVEAPNDNDIWIIMMFVHYACANLHPLVNNNMLTQFGSCSNKSACQSICLGIQLRHSRYINNYADYTWLTLSDLINFAWHNKFINTYPTSLLTFIRKFLTLL